MKMKIRTYLNKGHTQAELAAVFDLHQSRISQIMNRSPEARLHLNENGEPIELHYLTYNVIKRA